MLFKDKIFTYFSPYEKSSDVNKDINGKGTLERFNELMGDDIDTDLIPLVENLVKNVLEPKKCFDRFVPYCEADMGVRLTLLNTLPYRRAVLAIINQLHQIKGTKKAYTILFGMLGWTVVVTEFFDDWGFDSALTFDDAVRVFDSSVCPPCSDYNLDITTPSGIAPTPTELASIDSIIGFNEPINARLRKITFNTVVVTPAPDYSDDYSSDFLI